MVNQKILLQHQQVESKLAGQPVNNASSLGLGKEELISLITELRTGEWIYNSFSITGAHKHFSRQILNCRLTYTQRTTGQNHSIKLVAKIDQKAGEQCRQACEVLKELWEAGFQPSASFCVPQPFGCRPEKGLLVQAEAPGIMWADLLYSEGPELETAARRVANWVNRLQSLAQAKAGSAQMKLTRPEEYATLARRNAARLKALFPLYGTRLERIEDRLLQELPAPELVLVPSHGDFHPKNVFVTSHYLTVIDFDTFGVREAAFDVGYCIALLYIMSYFRTGSFRAGEQAGAAFWNTYRKTGQARWPRVALQVAWTLLDNLHYTFYLMKNSRVELVPVWLDLIESWSDASGPAIFGKFAKNSPTCSNLLQFKPPKMPGGASLLGSWNNSGWEREA